jgi:hypothetical protein
MCEMLRVTPNELLGFTDLKHERGHAAAAGLAEPMADETSPAAQGDADAERAGNSGEPLSSVAWQLASAAVAIRHEHAGKSKSVADPLEVVRETGALYRSLRTNPFGVVTEIAEDPALKGADAQSRAALAKLIRSFTEQASKRAGPRDR